MGIFSFFSEMMLGLKGASLRKKMIEFLQMLMMFSGLI